MQHINKMLTENAATTYGLKSNITQCERKITWEHRMAADAYFKESMVACAIEMSTGGELSKLDEYFGIMAESLEAAKDITELELNYLGEVYSSAENKKLIKNGKYGTKLHTAASVSILTRWSPNPAGGKGLERGFDEKSDLVAYLRNELTKAEMSFAAKDFIMREMGLVVDEALACPVIDDEFITSKAIVRNKKGQLKWGSIMGAVFWFGLAYKMHNQTSVAEDGSVRSFTSYVDSCRARLNGEINRCADEQWELGTYLIDEGDRVAELEHKVEQYGYLAPFAERLFDSIDMWNAVEEWSYEEDSEFGKIILHKVPLDKTAEEKERELSGVLDNMDRYEQSYRGAGIWSGGKYKMVKGKREWVSGELIGHKEAKKTGDSLYNELRAKVAEQAAVFKAV